MARALQVNLEYQPHRDKDKRLARAYELLAPLQSTKIDAAEKSKKFLPEETDETSQLICAGINGPAGGRSHD